MIARVKPKPKPWNQPQTGSRFHTTTGLISWLKVMPDAYMFGTWGMIEVGRITKGKLAAGPSYILRAMGADPHNLRPQDIIYLFRSVHDTDSEWIASRKLSQIGALRQYAEEDAKERSHAKQLPSQRSSRDRYVWAPQSKGPKKPPGKSDTSDDDKWAAFRRARKARKG